MFDSAENPFNHIFFHNQGRYESLHQSIESSEIKGQPLIRIACASSQRIGKLKKNSFKLPKGFSLELTKACERTEKLSREFFSDLKAVLAQKTGRKYDDLTDEDVNLYLQKLIFENEDKLEKAHTDKIQVIISYLELQEEIPGGQQEFMEQLDLDLFNQLKSKAEAPLNELTESIRSLDESTASNFLKFTPSKTTDVTLWKNLLIQRNDPDIICNISRWGGNAEALKDIDTPAKLAICKACYEIVDPIVLRYQASVEEFNSREETLSPTILEKYNKLCHALNKIEDKTDTLINDLVNGYKQYIKRKDKDPAEHIRQFLSTDELQNFVEKTREQFKSIKRAVDYQKALVDFDAGIRQLTIKLFEVDKKKLSADLTMGMRFFVIFKMNDPETYATMDDLSKMNGEFFHFDYIQGLHENMKRTLDGLYDRFVDVEPD